MTGAVYLVGAGPGAPDLLTLRAARLLADADIVLHDALVHPDTLALAVRALKVDVGKRCRGLGSAPATQQQFINKRLIGAARRHRVVVRLKGGDPMLFGRAQEELDALAGAGIRCEVVPGVTAALAAGAELRASLTQRGVARSVAFVTPRVGEGETGSSWARAAAAADTAVLYMAAADAAAVRTALLAAGLAPDLPAAVVESASLETSRTRVGTVAHLESLLQDRGAGPVVIVVGRAMARAAAFAEATAPRRAALSR